MKDSPLSCDFPETNLEGMLDKRVFRTRGARLASPPAKKVDGFSDSSENMSHSIAYTCDRFVDIRSAFPRFRTIMLGVINLFMMLAIVVMWAVDVLFSGEALLATAAFFVPVWVAFYLIEVLAPLTLPVRVDRGKGYVYVAHWGTYYRIPWDELEVVFSYNWQYFGAGVVWQKQYYSHVYLRDDYYFCGKLPKKRMRRKKFSSYFKEDDLYRNWNFIVRCYEDGVNNEDDGNLYGSNYREFMNKSGTDSAVGIVTAHFFMIIFMPSIIWWRVSPFKCKWPKEIEEIFGKENHY